MTEGQIIKALSGFYYVETSEGLVECRARGKVRKGTDEPLVGDYVCFSGTGTKGILEKILPRKNSFIRPAVCNLDALVILCANTNPITDPFLIDRVTAIAGSQNVPCVICVNKTDLDPAVNLVDTYSRAGYRTIAVSAETGAGIEELRAEISGKTVAFTGNSGVGKSSVLNRLAPELALRTGEVSEKLGRGRHTTRHVELFTMKDGTRIADTPGFSSFDTDRMELVRKENLARVFPDFEPFLDGCRYRDCTHRKEPDCIVRNAVDAGKIVRSRYDSYLRLYQRASEIPDWEIK